MPFGLAARAGERRRESQGLRVHTVEHRRGQTRPLRRDCALGGASALSGPIRATRKPDLRLQCPRLPHVRPRRSPQHGELRPERRTTSGLSGRLLVPAPVAPTQRRHGAQDEYCGPRGQIPPISPRIKCSPGGHLDSTGPVRPHAVARGPARVTQIVNLLGLSARVQEGVVAESVSARDSTQRFSKRSSSRSNYADAGVGSATSC